jgi:hypothetical protein
LPAFKVKIDRKRQRELSRGGGEEGDGGEGEEGGGED